MPLEIKESKTDLAILWHWEHHMNTWDFPEKAQAENNWDWQDVGLAALVSSF